MPRAAFQQRTLQAVRYDLSFKTKFGMRSDVLIPALVTVTAAFALGIGPRGQSDTMRRRWCLGLVVLGAVALIAVKINDAMGSSYPLAAVLPLQVCDVSSIACLIALRGGPRLASALVVYFGLDLSSIAIAFPDLGAGPTSLEYWLFWLRHGVILASGIFLLAIRGYRPTWPDFRRWFVFGVAYIAIVATLNRALDANYAFIGDRTLEYTGAVDAFGPWPGRAVAMLVLAVIQAAAVTWVVDLLRQPVVKRLTSQTSDS